MKNSLRNLLAATSLGVVTLTGVLVAQPAGATESETGGTRPRAWLAGLTDAQRQCLVDQGVTRLEGRPTAEQRQALRAAIDACGIEQPVRGRGPAGRIARLTPEQRQCLVDQGVTRPEGRPTAEQRQALRAAAAECGIVIPAAGPAASS